MLGDFYSPKQPQRGTIQKDTDMANDCYKKASQLEPPKPSSGWMR